MNQKMREISALALIVMGVAVFAGVLLPIRLPLGETAAAVALVWLGCCMMSGKLRPDGGEIPTWDNQMGKQTDCFFRRRMIDLRDTDQLEEALLVRVALGSVTVRLPVDASVTLCEHCLMGLCGGETLLLCGERIERCGSRDENAPKMVLHAHCLLGIVRFEMG